MKKMKRIRGTKWAFFVAGLIMATGLLMGCAATGAYGYHDHDEYEYDDYEYDGYNRFGIAFYGELAPYGEWIFIRPYGYVWRPFVVYGWRPFVHGHWVWSRYGWTWVSYEPFGWIVYHYGYWNFHPRIGWYWIPGYRWAPARVTWIEFGTYVAWAPLPPPGVHWPEPWEYGRYRYDYRRPHRHHGHTHFAVNVNVWVTVPLNAFTHEHVGRYHVESIPYRPYSGRSFRIKHRAPHVREVESIARTRIPEVHIQTTTVRLGKRKIQRIELPAREWQRVEKYRGDIERRVLKPRHRDRRENGKNVRHGRKEQNLHTYPVRPKYKKKDEE